MPLPIPQRPCYHKAVNFLTDLPPPLLVAVDRFSKACKLIPLSRLPTAFETAEALFNHVIQNS